MNPAALKEEKITIEIFGPDGTLKERSVWMGTPKNLAEPPAQANEQKGEAPHDS